MSTPVRHELTRDETSVIDACARLRSQAATDDPADVADKIAGIAALVQDDLPAGTRLAALTVLEDALETLADRDNAADGGA